MDRPIYNIAVDKNDNIYTLRGYDFKNNSINLYKFNKKVTFQDKFEDDIKGISKIIIVNKDNFEYLYFLGTRCFYIKMIDDNLLKTNVINGMIKYNIEEGSPYLQSTLCGMAFYKDFRFLCDASNSEIIYKGTDIFSINPNYYYYDMIIVNDYLYVGALDVSTNNSVILVFYLKSIYPLNPDIEKPTKYNEKNLNIKPYKIVQLPDGSNKVHMTVNKNNKIIICSGIGKICVYTENSENVQIIEDSEPQYNSSVVLQSNMILTVSTNTVGSSNSILSSSNQIISSYTPNFSPIYQSICPIYFEDKIEVLTEDNVNTILNSVNNLKTDITRLNTALQKEEKVESIKTLEAVKLLDNQNKKLLMTLLGITTLIGIRSFSK